MTKITKRSVDAASPAEKEWFLWDSEVKGFGLRVLPSGRKSFVLQYRSGGRTRRLGLGSHGKLSPHEARTLARRQLGQIAAGEDPSAERQKDRLAPNMTALCELFLERHVRQHCKPTTQREYECNCRLYIIPTLGTFRVQDVSRADIAALHHKFRRIPYQANRVLSTLSKMFNLAEIWDLRPDGTNPTRHVKRYKERKRERFLSPDEIGELFKTLDMAVRVGTETIFVVTAFKLLLLTGCRLSEIQTLKWSYIREDRMYLPDAKTGPRRVMLCRTVIELLASLEKQSNGPYVVAGKLPGQHVTDLQKPWRRIRKAAGLEDVRIHDLRHTYASFAAMAGQSLPKIGQLIGHTQAQSTQRYVHLIEDGLRESANDVDRIFREVIIPSPSDSPNLKLVISDRQKSLPDHAEQEIRSHQFCTYIWFGHVG